MSFRGRGVLLIGARGAGKSTVGPLLAEALGLPFFDSDLCVEEETGRTVAELLGDGSFRELEARCLARLLRGPPAVVAAGGGAVLRDDFAAEARGWRSVWLDADPEVLAARIAGDPPRPSLTGRPAHEEAADVARARAPLYAAVAWRRVPTDDVSPETICRRIEELLAFDAQAGRASSD